MFEKWGTILKPKKLKQPIVKKYREGKVKRSRKYSEIERKIFC